MNYEWGVGRPGFEVTIVTITYNDSVGLLRTLSSIGSSMRAQVELVVVEGHATDSAASREARAEAVGFGRVVWLQNSDDGVYDAMNRGLVASSGRWVWFINSGDTVAKFLDVGTLLGALGQAQSHWTVADAQIVNLRGQATRWKRSRDFSSVGLRTGTYTPCHQAVFARRTALAEVGLFDPSFKVAGDYHLFLRLDRRSVPDTVNLHVVDYLDGGISETQRRAGWREALVARDRLVERSRPDRILDVVRLGYRLLRYW